MSSVHVLWTCSSEFDADQQQGISFVRDDSFVMLAKPAVQTGERYAIFMIDIQHRINVMSNTLYYTNFSFYSWNFELKTIENVGMVLYNGGPDFVALEIVNSRLRFLVGKGSNAVELVTERIVSDGKWHNVSIAYSPFLVEVKITFPFLIIKNVKTSY